MNLTFEECVPANDCSINSDKGEGFLFSKTMAIRLVYKVGPVSYQMRSLHRMLTTEL